ASIATKPLPHLLQNEEFKLSSECVASFKTRIREARMTNLCPNTKRRKCYTIGVENIFLEIKIFK
ncbi:MAG: hypothetical protein ACRC2V_01540, partial [Xenococcaceae cyanobacterium]